MNDIIKQLKDNNINVIGEYNFETEQLEFIVKGFYKSDIIKLIETDGILFAHARYNEVTQIDNLSDLVRLNYKWWNSSKNKFIGWQNPDPKWKPLLIKEQLITT